jgi:hypothetical protein
MRNTSPQRTNALRLAVLTALKLMVVFWVVTPSRYKSLGGAFCLHLQTYQEAILIYLNMKACL